MFQRGRGMGHKALSRLAFRSPRRFPAADLTRGAPVEVLLPARPLERDAGPAAPLARPRPRLPNEPRSAWPRGGGHAEARGGTRRRSGGLIFFPSVA